MATIYEALAIAVEHHRGGRLQAAEQIYRQILAVEPYQADAMHLLGVLAQQLGKHELAVEYITRAIALNETEAAFHSNLGEAYRALGSVPEAVACYRRALELKPDYAEAAYNLGNVLQRQGQREQAAAFYRQALELKPDYAEAHNNLAVVFKDQGKLKEAVACYRRALELKPGYAEAHNNLGGVLHDLGKLHEAVTCYRRAVELNPDYAAAHNNLGNLLKSREQYAEARDSYQRALRSGSGWDLLRLSITAICPAVFESGAAIDEYRTALLAQVNDLAQGSFNLDLPQLGESAAEPPFNLLYHGRNDRPIKEAWAGLFRNLPVQEASRSDSPHPKLGLVVTRNHEGIFLRWCTQLLRRIKSDGWEIVIVCSLAGALRIQTALSGSLVQVLPVSRRFDELVETVREARLDVLCHWETGSDSTNYFLPFFRLCAGAMQPGGHSGDFRHPPDGLLSLQRVHRTGWGRSALQRKASPRAQPLGLSHAATSADGPQTARGLWFSCGATPLHLPAESPQVSSGI